MPFRAYIASCRSRRLTLANIFFWGVYRGAASKLTMGGWPAGLPDGQTGQGRQGWPLDWGQAGQDGAIRLKVGGDSTLGTLRPKPRPSEPATNRPDQPATSRPDLRRSRRAGLRRSATRPKKLGDRWAGPTREARKPDRPQCQENDRPRNAPLLGRSPHPKMARTDPIEGRPRQEFPIARPFGLTYPTKKRHKMRAYTTGAHIANRAKVEPVGQTSHKKRKKGKWKTSQQFHQSVKTK